MGSEEVIEDRVQKDIAVKKVDASAPLRTFRFWPCLMKINDY